MEIKHVMKISLGAIFSLVLLYVATKGVEWRMVGDACLQAQPALFAAGTLVFLSSWVFAAFRWKVLLNPAPGLRVTDALSFICIGYLANTLLPLRMGDLARATLMGKKKAIPVSRVLASMAIERVWDLIVLLLIAAPMILLLDIPGAIKTAIASMTVLAAVGFTVIVILSYRDGIFQGLIASFTSWLPSRVSVFVRPVVDGFCSGLAVIHRRSDLIQSWIFSIISWAVAGVGTWLWALAFGLDIPWYAGFFVLVLVNLGSAIPSSPGYIGVYHYLAVTALSIWVVDRETSLAYAIGTHGINMVANLVLGFYFLVREGIHLGDLKDRPAEPGA